MGFVNAILGAGGALLRQAIKSPNYEPGVRGWSIFRDGTAEFADMHIRSSDGSGATIDLENGHLLVRDAGGAVKAEVEPDGAIVTYDTRLGVPYYSRLVAATLELGLVDRPLVSPAYIDLSDHGGGLYETVVTGAHNIGKTAPEIHMYSGTAAGDAPRATAPGAEWVVQNLATNDGIGEIPVRGMQADVELVSFASATSYVSPVINFAHPFADQPAMTTNIMSGSGSTLRWDSRPINVTKTGFQLFVFSGDNPPAAAAWSVIPVAWMATPVTQ